MTAALAAATQTGGADGIQSAAARSGEQLLRELRVEPGSGLSAADVTMRKETLERLLGMLSYRERRVLELRYGLNGEQPCTLDEVGRTFNVTRERIRQIENQGLKKLRSLGDAQALRDVA